MANKIEIAVKAFSPADNTFNLFTFLPGGDGEIIIFDSNGLSGSDNISLALPPLKTSEKFLLNFH